MVEDQRRRFWTTNFQPDYSVLVFSLFSAWLLSFPFQGQVLYAFLKSSNIDTAKIVNLAVAAHFWGLIICGAIVKNTFQAKRVLYFAPVICLLGSLVFFSSFSVFWYVSLVGISFCSGLFIASWGFFFKAYTSSEQRFNLTADLLIYSNVLMVLINVIASSFSKEIALLLGICFLCFVPLLLPKIKAKKVPNSISKEKNLLLPIIYLFLFVTVITINSGLMYQVINPAFAHLRIAEMYFALPYILTLIIMKNLPVKVNKAYVLYMAITAIGIAFTLFMGCDRSVFSYLSINTLMQGAFGICDLFWWSIMAEMLEYSRNSAAVLGIGLGANVLGIFTGGLIGSFIATEDLIVQSMVALLVIFIVLMVLPLLAHRLNKLLKEHAFLTWFSSLDAGYQNKTISLDIESNKLTPRENEIMRLLLQGHTYKMIANRLYLSDNTVKTHIKNIYSKLEIKSKMELVQMFRK